MTTSATRLQSRTEQGGITGFVIQCFLGRSGTYGVAIPAAFVEQQGFVSIRRKFGPIFGHQMMAGPQAFLQLLEEW